MYPDIENKVAIVTGAAEGIGFAVAELLLQSGARVVLNDIDGPRLNETINRLEKKYKNKILACPGDAGDLETIDMIVNMAVRHFQGLDMVVANAGMTLFGDFLEFSPEDFQKIVDLNLRGAFFLTQKAAKVMIKHGRGGKIVIMSSNVSIQAFKDLTAYSMTKAALNMMARSLVLQLAPNQININAIAPGATLTERTTKEQPDYEGIWSKIIPRGAIALPQDIAKTCLFLLSDQSAHISGQTLVVDGGWSVIGKHPGDV